MRRALGVLLVAVAATACTSTISGSPVAVTGGAGADGQQGLVRQYFTDLNDAAAEGPTAQREFLRRTQHPDFTDRACDLGDLTLRIEPALTTLRPDPKWRPEKATQRPRGTVYVVGVTVRIRR